jgi:hypothetical protein
MTGARLIAADPAGKCMLGRSGVAAMPASHPSA